MAIRAGQILVLNQEEYQEILFPFSHEWVSYIELSLDRDVDPFSEENAQKVFD